jgi:hypothetical protein
VCRWLPSSAHLPLPCARPPSAPLNRSSSSAVSSDRAQPQLPVEPLSPDLHSTRALELYVPRALGLPCAAVLVQVPCARPAMAPHASLFLCSSSSCALLRSFHGRRSALLLLQLAPARAFRSSLCAHFSKPSCLLLLPPSARCHGRRAELHPSVLAPCSSMAASPCWQPLPAPWRRRLAGVARPIALLSARRARPCARPSNLSSTLPWPPWNPPTCRSVEAPARSPSTVLALAMDTALFIFAARCRPDRVPASASCLLAPRLASFPTRPSRGSSLRRELSSGTQVVHIRRCSLMFPARPWPTSLPWCRASLRPTCP